MNLGEQRPVDERRTDRNQVKLFSLGKLLDEIPRLLLGPRLGDAVLVGVRVVHVGPVLLVVLALPVLVLHVAEDGGDRARHDDALDGLGLGAGAEHVERAVDGGLHQLVLDVAYLAARARERAGDMEDVTASFDST